MKSIFDLLLYSLLPFKMGWKDVFLVAIQSCWKFIYSRRLYLTFGDLITPLTLIWVGFSGACFEVRADKITPYSKTCQSYLRNLQFGMQVQLQLVKLLPPPRLGLINPGIFFKTNDERIWKPIRKNIFACLFSVHNTISLSRHERVCLIRLVLKWMSQHILLNRGSGII